MVNQLLFWFSCLKFLSTWIKDICGMKAVTKIYNYSSQERTQHSLNILHLSTKTCLQRVRQWSNMGLLVLLIQNVVEYWEIKRRRTEHGTSYLPTPKLIQRNSKTDWLTNSMLQSYSWEANIFSADKLPSSWNLNIHHCVHNIWALEHILSQMNPVYNLPCYCCKIPYSYHPPTGLTCGLFHSGTLLLCHSPSNTISSNETWWWGNRGKKR